MHDHENAEAKDTSRAVNPVMASILHLSCPRNDKKQQETQSRLDVS